MKIENQFYSVEIEPDNGRITRLVDKLGGIELITEPRLADSFRLLLPLSDRQANYVLGREQKLTSTEESAEGVTLSWRGPLRSETGELFDLDVTMRIEFAGEAVHFRLDVDNGTPCQLAEVWYPILGGVTGVGERAETRDMIPIAGTSAGTNLFRRFTPPVGLGTATPEMCFGYPAGMSMPWADVYNPKLGRGVYIACHDEICRYKVLRFELQPGMGHREFDSWPQPGETELPVGLMINWAQFPYSKPGERYEGPPVVVQFHDGDWHAAARIYRKWFDSKFTLADTRGDWLHGQSAFQNTMLLLPEGNLLWRYSDILKLAKDGLEYDVSSILISGWDRGGHDSDYPYYEPDPRLGTWEELEAAIEECHRLGAKVYFFVNVQPVDCDTDWFREELRDYASVDPWGNFSPYGFGMGTLGARLGHTRRPLVSVSPSFPEFREIITRQMAKLAEIGADGAHIDKLWPFAGLDFNPRLQVSPDRATSEGMLKSVAEIKAACSAVNPDFRLSIETAWDRALECSQTAWAWHATATDHTPVLKYTFPDWRPTIAIDQPYDYTPVNHAVRYGYQIFVGPGHHTESMAFEPFRRLSGYIKEIVRLREELRETIYDGEFMDTLEVRFEGPDCCRYSSFHNRQSGKRACVVVNYGASACEVSVAFEGDAGGRGRVYLPYQEPEDTALPARVSVPGQRLAVVVEE